MSSPPRTHSTAPGLSGLDYSQMIRALNEVHYATETGFYATAGLRACEEAIWERYGQGARILDVGCGAGRVTRAIAERGGQITGMDINTAAMEAARRLATSAEYIEVSMTDLPMCPDLFDQVWCLRFSCRASEFLAQGFVRPEGKEFCR